MDLNELYNKLIAEGCNRFFIEGVGGPQKDDVELLAYHNGKWEVAYTERGKRSNPMFSTTDQQEAIRYYYDHVIRQQHMHLVTFTRSAAISDLYKAELEGLNLKVIQNDIPHYKELGDRIFRLFVINKDIFTAKKKMINIPYYDEDLKRY